MEVAKGVAMAVGGLALVDAVRRYARCRGVDTWTYVLEVGVVGAALGVIFTNGEAGTVLLRGLIGFVGFALSALLFDVWCERRAQ